MYIINVKNTVGESGTIVPDVSFRYFLNHNDLNEGDFKVSGTVVKRGLIESGSEVSVYRDGVLDFLGIIDMVDRVDGNLIKASFSGFEVKLSNENYEGAHSPWKGVASATIFSNIMNESSFWTAGTIASGFSIDFRLNESQTLWSGVINLLDKTQQDISRDYGTKEISIVDHLGSSSSIGVFNDGVQISNFRSTSGLPLGNKVVVYGKGDGESQIRGSVEDAGSIASFGKITKTVIDRSVLSDSEAVKLAEAELAMSKNPTRVYDFDLNNPREVVSLGDILTINSVSKDVISEEVRVVSVERGIIRGEEYCALQVSNPELRRLLKNRNKVISKLSKDNVDSNSYMQGSSNYVSFVTSDSLNDDKSMFLEFDVNDFFTDEIDALTISKVEMDFALDPFVSRGSSSVGESDRDPSYSGNTSSHGHDPSSPNHNHSTSSATSSLMSSSGDNNVSDFFGVSLLNGSDYSTSVIVPNLGSSVADMDWAIVTVSASVNNVGSLGVRLRIRNTDAGKTAYDKTVYMVNNTSFTTTVIFTGGDCWGNDNIEARFYNNSGDNTDISLHLSVSAVLRHTHTVSIGNVANTSASVSDINRTPSYSGNVTNHNHAVNLTAGSVSPDSLNGSSMTIVLQKWNGASWVNVNTKTINEVFETGIDWTSDITSGLHRFKFNTNSASFDHSRAVIRIKHVLEG